MKTEFRASFLSDIRKIKDRAQLAGIRQAIGPVEQATRIGDIRNIRKLAVGANFYRIRLGSYRIGLTIEGSVVTFVRFLHRREIYRYFP